MFCGYCVEACPCDAIRMDTGIFSLTGNKREDFVMDKEQTFCLDLALQDLKRVLDMMFPTWDTINLEAVKDD